MAATACNLRHACRLLVRQRDALSNHLRGILSEYGIVLPQGVKIISRRLPELLEDADNDLPMLVRPLLAELKAEHDQLVERIDRIEHRLNTWHAGNAVSQRLASIPGIDVLTATALAATVDEGQVFRKWSSTGGPPGSGAPSGIFGGKGRLLGNSKRCDSYLRSLLIHGTRAMIHHIRRRPKVGQPGRNPWVEQLMQRCHINEAAVKKARTAWVLLDRNETYCPACPV